MKKYKWAICLLFFALPFSNYGQSEIDTFPDFTKQIREDAQTRQTNVFIQDKDSHVEKIEYIKTLPKIELKDSSFSVYLKSDFSFKLDTFFDISIRHKRHSNDSILLSISFKNTSKGVIYISSAWYMDSSWNRTADFSTVDNSLFGLDCYTYFRMEKIDNQERINKDFYINPFEFDRINYEFYIINDMNKLIHAAHNASSFIRGLHRDRLTVDGINDRNIQEYKGLTRIALLHYPINDEFNEVYFQLEINK